MEESPSIELINLYLSTFTNKTINNGSTVKRSGQHYYPELNGLRVNLIPKTKVIFIESFDHKYYILHDDKFYNAIELTISPHVEEKKPKSIYRPPASHSWKAASYQRYIEKHNSKKKINS